MDETKLRKPPETKPELFVVKYLLGVVLKNRDRQRPPETHSELSVYPKFNKKTRFGKLVIP